METEHLRRLTISAFDPVYSAAGDLNEDGKVDLLIGGDNATWLYLGNGDGTFQSPQSIYSSYGPTKVADLDGDGHLDVAISPSWPPEQYGTIVVLRGNGDGTFGSGEEFPIGTIFNSWFALSDLNGDAKPEAIVSNNYDSLTVLLNIATATATPTPTVTSTPTPTATSSPSSTPRSTPVARPRPTPAPRPTP
jgi:hypothetical protein